MLHKDKNKNIYTISLSQNFAKDLTSSCLKMANNDAISLSNFTIFLPNRRMCRTIQEEFINISNGKPMLLPKLVPIGMVDEEELTLSSPEEKLQIRAAINPIKRQILLTKLILKSERTKNASQAANLALELAALIDQIHLEELSYDKLEEIVPEEFATHWQETLSFLKIITEFWPLILEEQNLVDGAKRQVELLDAQSDFYKKNQPKNIVIAAGIVSAFPAVIRFLDTISQLENGMVILQGLDKNLDDESFAQIDETHPQFGMKQIISNLGVERKDVLDWSEKKYHPRDNFITEIMRPAPTTDKWQDINNIDINSVSGIKVINCPTPVEESTLISIVMRKNLQEEAKTVSLVTTDRNLARRVSAQLKKWNIVVDDSAGVPLHLSNAGIFLRLIAQMVISDFEPAIILSALKHPLASFGMKTAEFRNIVRKLEIKALRGIRPAEGIKGIISKIDEKEEDLILVLKRLENATEEFSELIKNKQTKNFKDFLFSHIKLAETIAQTDEKSGDKILWAKEDGICAANFVSELINNTDEMTDIDGEDYIELFKSFMYGVTVRSAYGSHPRLSILGPLEARLQRPDVVILGGLNEGTWPKATDTGPWLSRPMKKDFGMSSPEKTIGLAAHDISHALCGNEVFITRSIRVDGAPTVPSRWLLRMDTILKAAKIEDQLESIDFSGEIFKNWAEYFYIPEEKAQPCEAPAPTPPLYARPRKLSVTQIEKLMRDPYSVYANKVLNLKALDEIDSDPGASEYGSIIHDILESFVKKYPTKDLPQNVFDELITIGQKAFDDENTPPSIKVFWWAKFLQVIDWFAKHEQKHRKLNIEKILTEVWGSYKFESKAGEFEIFAKADRIEAIGSTSTIGIVDYKTGAPPKKKEVAAGFAPQLPLEAAIAKKGGFEGISRGCYIDNLSYWHLKGGNDGGKAHTIYNVEKKEAKPRKPSVPKDFEFLEKVKSNTSHQLKDDAQNQENLIKAQSMSADEITDKALDGLKALISAYDDENTPYNAVPHPEYAPKYSDYKHLARIAEWLSQED
jgi:ATP-dependent helicase/nuclease subunit B